jgi:hypothetical protein
MINAFALHLKMQDGLSAVIRLFLSGFGARRVPKSLIENELGDFSRL